MKQLKLVAIILVVLVLAVFLWLAAVPVNVALGRSIPTNTLTRLGMTGDLFGSMTSFFSGLAALGLIVILVLDRETRLNNNPPFLSVLGKKATVKNASFDEDGLDLQVSLELTVTNLTASPALNPALRLPSRVRWDIAGNDVPIAGDIPATFTAKLNLRGERGERILEEINSANGFLVPMILTYKALNKTVWTSKASVRLMTSPTERSSVSKILQRDENEYIKRQSGGGTSDVLEIDADFVSGTWEHARS